METAADDIRGKVSGSRSWGVEPGRRALALLTAIPTENRAHVVSIGLTTPLHRRYEQWQ